MENIQTTITDKAVDAVRSSRNAFCKFIVYNEIPSPQNHQSGFYVCKGMGRLMFEQEPQKGENAKKEIWIDWQGGSFKTASNVYYYGVGTRNEYRITTFGRGFEFLRDEHIGDLLVMVQDDIDNYRAFVLSTDEEINEFFSRLDLSIADTNKLINKDRSPDEDLRAQYEIITNTYLNFPETRLMGELTRDSYRRAFHVSDNDLVSNPDTILVKWISAEYDLFKAFEEKIYKPRLETPFPNIQELIEFSNGILNRRKSRAGKSLEHHLAAIFDANKLLYEEQVITEDNKKPDFIFPDGDSYHTIEFPAENLIFLGAKTTCKDRWRQVLNEANRIPDKHLFTLQEGISSNQLREMQNEHLTLVVPSSNVSKFPKEYQPNLMTLSNFIGMVKEKQR